MSYKIVNPPKNLDAKYLPFVIKKNIALYTKKEKFVPYTLNIYNYNYATNKLVEVLLWIINYKDSFFKEMFVKYCDAIYVTSSDRPYTTNKNSSHAQEGRAVDFVLFPYWLNPLFHGIIKKYAGEIEFSSYISLVNHHIHFNVNDDTPKTGVEVAKQGNKFIYPKNVSTSLDNLIDSGQAVLSVEVSIQNFAVKLLEYWNVDTITTSYLMELANGKNPLLNSDYKKIVETICRNYEIEVETFTNYLKTKGMYQETTDYTKNLTPDNLLKFIGGSTPVILILGGLIAYKAIDLIKNKKAD